MAEFELMRENWNTSFCSWIFKQNVSHRQIYLSQLKKSFTPHSSKVVRYLTEGIFTPSRSGAVVLGNTSVSLVNTRMNKPPQLQDGQKIFFAVVEVFSLSEVFGDPVLLDHCWSVRTDIDPIIWHWVDVKSTSIRRFVLPGKANAQFWLYKEITNKACSRWNDLPDAETLCDPAHKFVSDFVPIGGVHIEFL